MDRRPRSGTVADATLNQLIEQMHMDANRLAEHVGTPDLANLRDRLFAVGDTVGSLAEGDHPGPGPSTGRRETVLDLTTALHKDLAQLAARLHQLDPTDENWAAIARELLADSIQLKDLATSLKGARSGYEPVAHAHAKPPSTAPLQGTTAGARPTSLDAAGRAFQSVLAQQNRQR